MSKNGIEGFLLEHARKTGISFHMPGHKGAHLYEKYGFGEFLEHVMACDITEIPGADNLYQTEGIIAETMEKYKNLYHVNKSYLLVNGSTVGLIASVLSAVSKGGKLIMARNCHKSVFNALQLGDIIPVYAFPETLKKYGLLGEISPQEIVRCMDENPEAEAVIIPSPNYYGICSDIEAIAKEVHRRGKILIVDQAHGAHLKFFQQLSNKKYPKSAEQQGADMVINSIHKTLASWTQSALLNVCSDKVPFYVLEDKLQILESSSPSYPLMASMDINAQLLMEHGDDLMTAWDENLDYIYEELKKIPGLMVMEEKNLDRTKINIDMSAYGIDGNQLEDLFMNQNIYIELVSGNMVMLMSGIGNRHSDFERVIETLKHIAETHILDESKRRKQPAALVKNLERRELPTKKEWIFLEEGDGRVCASSLIPYPPGIPIACPGEVLDEELVAYIKQRRLAKEKVIGVNEKGMILVGVEEKIG